MHFYPKCESRKTIWIFAQRVTHINHPLIVNMYFYSILSEVGWHTATTTSTLSWANGCCDFVTFCRASICPSANDSTITTLMKWIMKWMWYLFIFIVIILAVRFFLMYCLSLELQLVHSSSTDIHPMTPWQLGWWHSLSTRLHCGEFPHKHST